MLAKISKVTTKIVERVYNFQINRVKKWMVYYFPTAVVTNYKATFISKLSERIHLLAFSFGRLSEFFGS